MTTMIALPAGSLMSAGVRAYFAPVDRAGALPVPFDPSSMGRFALDAPPSGWWNAGNIIDFKRASTSAITPVLSGAPATIKTQVRSSLGADIEFVFPAWSRVGMALSAGVQTMNLLLPANGANANPSGGAAAAAELVLTGSTSTVLQLTPATAVQAGDLVAVDLDYTGQTGYLGSGAPGTYLVNTPANVDVHAVRRVSFNVARVLTVNAGVVTLAAPLPAGTPVTLMKVSRISGFVDREGGAFMPEWSGLFVMDGVQGDRLLLHFPRLQPAGTGAPEVQELLAASVHRWRPAARLRALPVIDANDGAASVCFRTYLPAPMRLV